MHVLAIDQGTTGSTVLVLAFEEGRGARVLSRGYSEFPQHFPQPGWVEHDLEEIWASVESAAQNALDAAGVGAKDIRAVGITNQRETTGIWSVDGEPIHRAIVWQDRRTAPVTDRLKADGLEAELRAKTGLVADPYFSGTKVAWLLDAVDGARARAAAGELRFGTVDSWLIWKLSGGDAHVTDATNASRTLMFDIHRGEWDPELLRILGDIPASLLPQVMPSSGHFAVTRNAGFLPDGIPITGVAGDQHAATFGQACFQPGMAKCTYGTGAFALVNVGSDPVASENGLLTTIAWQLGDETTYALEGAVFVAGAIVQWLRDELRFFSSSAEIEALAQEVKSSEGVYLVPALTGLGAPHWRPDARGIINGLTRGTSRAHIARAALEGIAFQVHDLLDAMAKDLGSPLKVLRVDGGAAANDLLMQFQADLLGVECHRPSILDTTALGAGYLAALGVGIFSDLDEVRRAWEIEHAFQPAGDPDDIKERLSGWHRAVAATAM
ncbi:MAG: glycerol kinase GlpK [Myxococcota bacterium]